MDSSSAQSFPNVHLKEKEQIRTLRKDRNVPEGGETYLGLALSGGGIRSATFNLGVLQALAGFGFLRYVDYLSTVSGGGYIGSWLVAWIKRTSLEDVTDGLQPEWDKHTGTTATPEIKFLRNYSNYLTPKVGFFSADTWTMVTTWLRNTILCQAVLIPALVAMLLTPRLVGWAMHCSARVRAATLLGIGTGLPLLVAVIFIGWNLKLIVASLSQKVPPPGHNRIKCPLWILTLVVGSVILAAWFASCGLWLHAASWVHIGWIWFAGLGALAYFVLWLIGFFISRLWGITDLIGTGSWGRAKFWVVLILSTLGSGAVGGLLIKALVSIFYSWNSLDGRAWHNLTFGTPLVTLVFMATIVVHIGLLGDQLPDPLREWLSKAGAWLFIFIMSWIALFGTAVYGPLAVVWLLGYAKARLGVLLAWVLTTVGGILAGKNPSTGRPGGKSWVELLAKVSPFVFAAGLLLLLSFGVNEVLPRLIGKTGVSPGAVGHLSDKGSFNVYRVAHWFLLTDTANGWLILVIGVCVLAALFLSWRVDLNEFSMHMFYRNRLVRCYLGASHEGGNHGRKPNPFTGFDARDDTLLADLAQSISQGENKDESEKGYSGPYPILNTTLNATCGESLAWQDRRAESFVMTPLFCGFEPGERVPGPCAKPSRAKEQGYRPTRDYAYPGGGLYLGTAMGISGAAASPNMGYHTSTPLAFLMTVFNVRLGQWLGNPRRERQWKKAGPKLGLVYLVKELFASTDDRSGYVYLSDGGHFENLGIYELVRRRCRYIIVGDGSSDPELQFGDLGNAVRKCRMDFGVDIDIKVDRIRRNPETHRSLAHCAVGTIRYPDAPEGTLVYLKPTLTGDEPADVLEYDSEYTEFPHQTTADQWFDESQFEAYRKLGCHIARDAFNTAAAVAFPESRKKDTHPTVEKEELSGDRKERFFRSLEWVWSPPSAAVEKFATKLADDYDEILERIRKDTALSILDSVLYPEFNTSPQDRNVKYICNSLIELMMNVYRDLNLESESAQPHNQGWIRMFRQWRKSPGFIEAWKLTSPTYSEAFRRFCERVLDLPYSTGPEESQLDK